AGDFRRAGGAQGEDSHQQAARQLAKLSRHSIHADVSSGVPAAHAQRQAAGVGGYSGSDEISRDADSAPRRFAVVRARTRLLVVAMLAIAATAGLTASRGILAADAPPK